MGGLSVLGRGCGQMRGSILHLFLSGISPGRYYWKGLVDSAAPDGPQRTNKKEANFRWDLSDICVPVSN